MKIPFLFLLHKLSDQQRKYNADLRDSETLRWNKLSVIVSAFVGVITFIALVVSIYAAYSSVLMSEADQMAYLDIDKIKYNSDSGEMEIYLKNYGHSRANISNVNLDINRVCYDKEKLNTGKCPTETKANVPFASAYTLPPDQEFFAVSRILMPMINDYGVAIGHEMVRLNIKYTYDDIFSHSHTEKRCIFIRNLTPEQDGTISQKNMVSCEQD